MDLVLLAARLVLAVVFVVAGVAKLADLPGSRQAMIGFGVPTSLAGVLGTLLPLAELATAVLLIPLATAWWGSLAALTLLLLFLAGIAVTMARGQAPDCHCFGQLHSEPVGWSTVGRNLLLALIAGLIVATGSSDAGSSAVGWIGDRSGMDVLGIGVGVLLTLAIIGEGWLLLHLLQQNGRLLARVETLEASSGGDGVAPRPTAPAAPVAGLPVGSLAPSFSLSGLHGETLTLDALRASGKPTLLLFSDPHCGPCNALLPEIGRWQRDEARRLTLALISRGSVEENRAKGTEHGVTQILLQTDREVAEAYQSHGTPGAVLIGIDGRIQSPLAMGAEQIRQLVRTATGAPVLPLTPRPASNGNGNGNGSAPPPASRIGTPAPAVSLPDLDGKTVQLTAFTGERTLLLFWNPGCGFCQRMLGDLKEWEARRSQDAPKLLVVSTGTVEANQQLGLRSTVVLDQGFTTGRAFGATGTPSAILVREDGTIGSEVAVGAQAVLALAGNLLSRDARDADEHRHNDERTCRRCRVRRGQVTPVRCERRRRLDSGHYP